MAECVACGAAVSATGTAAYDCNVASTWQVSRLCGVFVVSVNWARCHCRQPACHLHSSTGAKLYLLYAVIYEQIDFSYIMLGALVVTHAMLRRLTSWRCIIIIIIWAIQHLLCGLVLVRSVSVGWSLCTCETACFSKLVQKHPRNYLCNCTTHFICYFYTYFVAIFCSYCLSQLVLLFFSITHKAE